MSDKDRIAELEAVIARLLNIYYSVSPSGATCTPSDEWDEAWEDARTVMGDKFMPPVPWWDEDKEKAIVKGWRMDWLSYYPSNQWNREVTHRMLCDIEDEKVKHRILCDIDIGVVKLVE